MKTERLENGMFRLSGPVWKNDYPEERREAWIAWYEKMYQDHGRPTYKAAADALRSLEP